MAETDDLARSMWCSTVGDLYKSRARLLVYRFIRPWLEGKKASVCELLYTASLQNSFLNSGAYYSNAVQKIAIAQVANKTYNIQDRVKEIYAFTDAIVLATRQNPWGDNDVVDFTPDDVPSFIQKVENLLKPENHAQAINRSIAAHLETITEPIQKLEALVAMLKPLPDANNSHLDDFIADLLMSGSLIQEALGESAENYFTRVIEIIEIYKGKFNNPASSVMTTLSNTIHVCNMPSTQEILEDHIITALEQNQPLVSEDLNLEFAALNDLMNALKYNGSKIGGEDTDKLINKRASWLLTDEKVATYLSEAVEREERANLILRLYDKVPGAKNRRQVLSILEFIMMEWADRVDSTAIAPPTLETLKTLGSMHQILFTTDMPDTKKEKIFPRYRKIYDTITNKLNIFGAANDHDRRIQQATELIELVQSESLLPHDRKTAIAIIKDHCKADQFMEKFIMSFDNERTQKIKMMELLKVVGDI